MKPFSGSVSEPGSLRETTWTQLITESQQPDPQPKKPGDLLSTTALWINLAKMASGHGCVFFFLRKSKKSPKSWRWTRHWSPSEGVVDSRVRWQYVLELKGVLGWLVHVQWLRFDGCPDFSRRGMIESAKPMAYDVKCWRPQSNRLGFTCFFSFPMLFLVNMVVAPCRGF